MNRRDRSLMNIYCKTEKAHKEFLKTRKRNIIQFLRKVRRCQEGGEIEKFRSTQS
jgi:hypothetical protein